MKQDRFEQAHAETWEAYRNLLQRLEGPGRSSEGDGSLERFPQLFRRLCNHYVLARGRGYSPRLTHDLRQLIQRGYRKLYRRRIDWPHRALAFFSEGFPRTLRRHGGIFWLAATCFFGPMLAMGWGCHRDAELIYSILNNADVAGLESMYDPTNRKPGREAGRQADTDFAMFGFYVMNNVGIAFRTFAGGLALGLGSLFFLGFNGLVIGGAAGHLTQLGFGSTFWPFVSGHSALELTAIAISGAAGLLLAAALVAPGRRRRLDALRANAREAAILITGAFAMLVLAALVEAFWSSAGGMAPAIKYLVGALGWVLVILYFGLAGRGAPDGA